MIDLPVLLIGLETATSQQKSQRLGLPGASHEPYLVAEVIYDGGTPEVLVLGTVDHGEVPDTFLLGV